ncbi:hypothetical protein FB45DRAFT_917144 [Roridomyces roridus]|uniref:Uncharacterized protein n=1 Tax=Roridomyces roridus TaxID=1738132 RepID=A0AAD7BUG4_9AGAR|nr:hypothetical protein FB45DRAFT_917144 [Roridomyces roridus]
MKPREYCCCAIPLVNAGIYFTLIEQLVLGALVGGLALSTPKIVGAVTPSFAALLLGLVAIGMAAVQILGFIGVAGEKSGVFRTYATLHSLITTAAFSIALTWIILSATRHSTAKSDCLNQFFSNATTEEKSEGDTLCNIFPFVETGVMGGLWVLLAVVQGYLFFVVSSYSAGQQRDHAQYGTLGSSNSFQNETIPMGNRNDPYDPPYQQKDMGGYSHVRKDSAASMSDVMAEGQVQPSDSYSVERQATYPPRQPSLPQNAYTLDENPTPRSDQSYYSAASGNIEKPAFSQAHPGE